jgi:general L-amino acid transport system permease protein
MPKPVLYDGGWIVIVAFILSLIAVLFYRRYARKTLFDHGLILPVLWPSLAILFVPTLAMFFLLGSPIGLEYPALKGFNFKGGIWARGSLLSLWFALSIYTGAFIAENVRAGIQAVSKGQSEAAASLGLRPGRIMNLVILPQALRVIIPPLISNYLNLTKNSSLAIAVGYMDVTGTLGGITLNQTGRAIETILLLMAFYLTISLGISAIMNVYNNSIKLKGR